MSGSANNILVVGLGMTGLSVVRFLTTHYPNSKIKLIDTRDNPKGSEELPSNVEFHFGGWRLDWVLESSLIIANPGIALATPQLQQAIANNIPVIGDIELFARHVNKPVLGITGSNGKSTVTALVGEMAKADNINVGVGGNIGVAALDLLTQDHDLYILELSSFQLETTFSLKMLASTFLNLSEDHLDRYSGMQAYKEAKLKIFAQSKLAIFNVDDAQTKALKHPNSLSFGFSNADYSIKLFNDKEWLFAKEQAVIAAEDIALIGRHNIANCLAAMALADTANISKQAQIQAMKTYHGLAHRCQKVAKVNGVTWVNDSKATNPASTQAALDGLQLKGTLHLLVGGDGKGADFSSLQPILNQLDVALYCFGKDAKLLALLNENAAIFNTMNEAMKTVAKEAKSGDMVLLSPACASLDQFENFMQRGQVFTDFAQALKKEFANE